MAIKYGYLDESHLSDIASAIREKNGTASEYSLSNMAAGIRAISVGIDTSDATATSTDMLKGTTAYAKGAKVTGSIETASPVIATINPGESKDVPAGYYTQSSQVTASLADSEAEIASSIKAEGTNQTIVPGGSATISAGKYYTTNNTVTASLAKTEEQIDATLKVSVDEMTINPGESAQVTGGRFFTSNIKVISSLADEAGEISDTIKTAGVSETINPGSSKTINGGKYYTTDSIITADLATLPSQIDSSIKENQTVTALINGPLTVTPSEGKVLTGVTVNAPDTTATATEEDIISGMTAYVNGVKITGTRSKSEGGIDTSDATAEEGDIIKGKTAYAKGVKITGSLEFITCYSGDTEPSSTLGEDGDIYILITDGGDTPETAGSISTTDNSITLSDDLAPDTYTLKYEDTSGAPLDEWAEIGTVTKS